MSTTGAKQLIQNIPIDNKTINRVLSRGGITPMSFAIINKLVKTTVAIMEIIKVFFLSNHSTILVDKTNATPIPNKYGAANKVAASSGVNSQK